MVRLTGLILVLGAVSFCAPRVWAGQAEGASVSVALPDAPEPQMPAASPDPKPRPCPAPKPAGSTATSNDPEPPTSSVTQPVVSPPCKVTWANRYDRFVNGPQDKPLTPKDKAWLAARNMVDPFNTITILGDAAISVGADSHSLYGPGMPGFARYVGVSFTQDLTGEFFGTFLIPSIVHQDPHYHRMPQSGIPRRIGWDPLESTCRHASLSIL